jgi:DNA-binding NarL/FixJ family response regulator
MTLRLTTAGSLGAAAYILIPVATQFRYELAFHLLFITFAMVIVAPQLLPATRLGAGPQELARQPDAAASETIVARYRISPRELEITRLLLAGRTNAEIAEALCIASNTVKNHVYSIYRKTGARSRIQLANLVRDSRPSDDRPSRCEPELARPVRPRGWSCWAWLW